MENGITHPTINDLWESLFDASHRSNRTSYAPLIRALGGPRRRFSVTSASIVYHLESSSGTGLHTIERCCRPPH